MISLFIKGMLQGRRPIIFGDGEQTRDFTYVANAVAANLAAMRHPHPLAGEVFNVGSGERISLLDLVATLTRFLGTDLEPELQPPRAGDVRATRWQVLEKISELLSYRPVVNFAEGLKRTVEASRGIGALTSWGAAAWLRSTRATAGQEPTRRSFARWNARSRSRRVWS